MKLLVTGAGGFLGRHVVASAVRSGHQVRALLRPAAPNVPPGWEEHSAVEVVRGDLRVRGLTGSLVAGIDAVVHLAAAKSGDLYEQFAGTVLTTENLIGVLPGSGVKRLVVTGSFSIYEYLQRRAWSMLDESSALAADADTRDEYCQTKLVQERLVLESSETGGFSCVVLRPGVIYGRDNLWTARLGMQLGSSWWLRTGTFAPLPLTYVENCADAIVLAASYQGPQKSLVLNVVDDQTPSQRAYLKELQKLIKPRPRIIPIPWTVMRMMARCAWLSKQIFFKGNAKLPGLLVPSRLHARCKPLRYSNRAIKETLGWQPRYHWREAVARSVSGVDTAVLPDPEADVMPFVGSDGA